MYVENKKTIVSKRSLLYRHWDNSLQAWSLKNYVHPVLQEGSTQHAYQRHVSSKFTQ